MQTTSGEREIISRMFNVRKWQKRLLSLKFFAAALINQLKWNGNAKPELIVTGNKGLKIGGHPHSSIIINEAELLLWYSKTI